MDVNLYSTKQLEKLPTIRQGQADDLKVERKLRNNSGVTHNYRWWLSRCGIEDGMPAEHCVTVERFTYGNWSNYTMYDGDTLITLENY